MILHTTVPYEMIFPAEMSGYEDQRVITYNGIPIIVQQDQQGCRVVRIISSDPQHFIDDTITPGEYLSISF
ncbi:YlzJ-like family protein [Bacillus sp. 2205SS5-2]|uniref:YlzJ-like family protein n=1 Tax=Bacillus sp. 2205SS5-2 TaxID=3109031 RepID=UPI003005790D